MDLLRVVWAHKQNVEAQADDRWWWDSPEPPIFVVEDVARGALAGLCAYMPFSLRTGGREWPAAWFVDFFVRAEHQGKGLGRQLTDAVQAEFAITASLSQTDMAYRVFAKLGWRERYGVDVYMHPLPQRWPLRPPSRGLHIARASVDDAWKPPAGIDALWARVRDTFPTIAIRDGEALRRRYQSRGSRQYTFISCARGADCAGYAVARTIPATPGGRPSHGLIVDVVAERDDDDAIIALLADARAQLADDGAARIFCLSTVPAWQRLMRRRGFLSPATPLLGRSLASNRKWLTYHSKPDVPSVDPAGWFLTIGDCDLDYAW